ncbi:M56 family metallopeptidase [Bdellovibrio sp. KM01]|uniref:M56 family metallopeptidase n=1 Tax=Bdellovibrio sp. KM01 TaxID=2748865 RepID=UPI0015EA8317|nr:M56 family metallopeptidase [Bdellovibrio sp. KM01]QLY24653.1 M56 family metallopeptidase [Bdellovibrio sp. KM01]
MSTLDFLWKLLVVLSLSSIFFFGSFSLGTIAFKGLRGKFLRQWSRITIAAFLLSMVSFAVILMSFDQGLELGCFSQFVKSQGSMGVTRILGLLWGAGFGVWFGHDLYRHRQFISVLKNEILEDRGGFILTSNQMAPLSYGLTRGRVSVPVYVAQNPEHLKHVLAHEFTHVQGRDGFWNLLETICLRLCWFNPLMQVFHRQYQLYTEMATDELAIERYQLNPKAYAECLLVLMREPSFVLPGFVSGASAEFLQMQARLKNIGETVSVPPAKRKWALSFSMLLLWLLGVNQSWASLQIQKPLDPSEMVCMQIQHELVIEKLLQVQPESNKCE